MLKILFLFQLLFFFFFSTGAQSLQFLYTDSAHASLRGLSVPNDSTVWASGTNGTVLKTTNGGADWQKITVTHFETRDFRDIIAFDAHTALVMAIDSPAYILKTIDGGRSWRVVYEDHRSGMFLDDMDFMDERNGWVLGDPLNGAFFIAKTTNGGSSWQPVLSDKYDARPGEAAFAASGSNMRIIQGKPVFAVGGSSAYIVKGDRKIELPVLKGTTSQGPNSLGVFKDIFIVVGGDFTKPDDTTGVSAFSLDGGNTWGQSQTQPSGYRSCVEHLEGTNWISCGLSGIDITGDNGSNWEKISSESFHVVRKSRTGTDIYLAGKNGRIARLSTR